MSLLDKTSSIIIISIIIGALVSLLVDARYLFVWLFSSGLFASLLTMLFCCIDDTKLFLTFISWFHSKWFVVELTDTWGKKRFSIGMIQKDNSITSFSYFFTGVGNLKLLKDRTVPNYYITSWKELNKFELVKFVTTQDMVLRSLTK